VNKSATFNTRVRPEVLAMIRKIARENGISQSVLISCTVEGLNSVPSKRVQGEEGIELVNLIDSIFAFSRYNNEQLDAMMKERLMHPQTRASNICILAAEQFDSIDELPDPVPYEEPEAT
jgi:hypothetical protein